MSERSPHDCPLSGCEGRMKADYWFPDARRDDHATRMDGFLVVIDGDCGHSWNTTGYRDKALRFLKKEYGGIR